MEKINLSPSAGPMPSLSYAEKAIEAPQPSEVETLPMQITHAEMIEQSLSRCPGIGQGRNLAREFPAPRELPNTEGGITRAEMVEQSQGVLPGTGGSTVAAKVNPRVEPKYESRR
jgi:hypothetical protein